jgi:hypothetical protein
MAKKDINRGMSAEIRKTKEHGGTHQGGPGNPDYTRGNVKGEIKTRESKVTKPELQKLIKKGVTEIDSKAGFTKPAIEYRDRYQKDVKLISKKKKI